MSDTRLPTEVELVYEVMSSNAMRTEFEPSSANPHPCTYFRKWGTYHSYDYVAEGPPPEPGIVHESRYMGRARLVPELLSGCRKGPIMAVGINPNLPGWWSTDRRALNPLFDDYKQYAHYFRYRAIAKLALSPEDYAAFGGGPEDTPFSTFQLNVPVDDAGDRKIALEVQPQKMYEGYQALLSGLAREMGWKHHRLAVGEDLTYGNMVACPSARWTTIALPAEPDVPPMTVQERNGIVTECFHHRQYFLRQLFQSLPAVLLVFSQSTANALIGELQNRFSAGDPKPGESIDQLMQREVRLHYGDLADGMSLDARVIFAPHITGNPHEFALAKARVIEQLVEESKAGHLRYNLATRHLARTRGACVFCPMLEIGPCDYIDELQPISPMLALTAESPLPALMTEKVAQQELLANFKQPPATVEQIWALTDDDQEERAEKSERA